MAYEYECEEVIKNVIKELIYFKKGKNELAEKEIDEVYTKAKAFDELKTFVNENSIENINDDLYDAGYVEACNDILEKIRMEDE